MRYSLRHVTSYDYGTTVDLSHHVVRLDVRELTWQRAAAVAVSASPEPARRSSFRDHFGNRATLLAIESPHDRFAVTLEAEVEVRERPLPDPEHTPGWEEVRDLLSGDGLPGPVEECEFALDSPLAAGSPALSDYAASSFDPHRPVLSAAIDLTGRIHREFRYDPAATDLSTPLSEVFARRAGVCQDFAHLQVAALRSLGLAARYVSGYIATHRPAGDDALRGADASHAWASVWCGTEFGWIDLDPTNDLVVGTEHVIAAWGRDYGDVSPVRGVILGGGAHSLSVAVDLRPLTS